MRIVPADFEARRAALRERQEVAAAPGPRRSAKASRIIAEQRAAIAELESLVDILKGALAADRAQTDLPAYSAWMEGLTRQERAMMGALHRAYPRPMSKEALVDLLPGQDHVEDRSPQMVAVKVCHLRRKLGQQAIEHVANLGYRLSRAQYEAMRRPADADVGSPELRLAA